ncbi:response regulator [Paenibacillus sp. J2TS4]|uniref:response regulator n=1 Tax=Paenibacillus sp. J2TS4 TaxID=2807194 RepID=UPI001AFF0D88|nr:response regulator [Paenibacillus sp. J2TS4]GIP34073.1 hypothetical protein J2TS4_32830 [Paenibacillus sp. J2TS4]
MKIRTKLFLGFGALIFLMFALAGIGINRLSSIDKNINEIYQNRYNKVKFTSNTRTEVFTMNNLLVNLILNEPRDREALIREINESSTKALTYLNQLGEQSETAEEKQLLEAAIESFDTYSGYKKEAISLVSSAKRGEAAQLRETEGNKISEALQQRLDELAKYHEQRMDEQFLASRANNRSTLTFTLLLSIVGLLLGLGIMFWIIYSITGGLNRVSKMISSFASGTIDAKELKQISPKDEIGEVAEAFSVMALDLQEKTKREREMNRANEEQAWLKSNLAQMTTHLNGLGELEVVSQAFISEVTPMLGASYAVMYLLEGENQNKRLKLSGSYAFQEGIHPSEGLKMGEGLVGQCALDEETILLKDVPADYIKINSGLGEITPVNLVFHPIRYEDELIAVVELASLNEFTPLQLHLLEQLGENVGIVLKDIIGRKRVEELLRISQGLTEELQAQSEELLSQQEELKASNERLEEKTRSLQRSEEMLQRQQEELEQANDELVQKTQQLELQIEQTEQVNRQIQQTKNELERQALQLALTSKYKSEFLANMSHELRTPLNSLLVLSQLLADNREGNLDEKQVEFAETIHSSGMDLLRLIDEILDLSKVEAGRMEVQIEPYSVGEIEDYVRRNFAPIAKKNGLGFHVIVEEEVPGVIKTDPHRLQQILRNLLSNAFKFTKEGSITFHVKTEESPSTDAGNSGEPLIAFSVIDTGIGVSEEKRELIFEAFRQADGTTSRKYGGTGLGLSISRELARLLGGTITLSSEEGRGSIFTLYLPVSSPEQPVSEPKEVVRDMMNEVAVSRRYGEPSEMPAGLIIPPVKLSDPKLLESPGINDDRDLIEPNDKVLLVIEDDIHFVRIIMEMARTRGFKTIAALRGDQGLALARKYQPDAIILDIQLPVVDGWSVLNRLKDSSETRHIPVHVMSVVDESQQGLTMGAIAYLKKPASKERLDEAFTHIQTFLEKKLKHLLIVEEDEELRRSLVDLIGYEDVQITALSSGQEALRELDNRHYDCMVLDLGLSEMSGFDLLEAIRNKDQWKQLPIIIYTGKELDKSDEIRLKKYAESIIIKNVKSPERLFDETALFLHRVEANLPEDKRQLLEELHNKESAFEGKNILLVDDDIRNVFALSSVLESFHMNVSFAENGVEALQVLEQKPEIDLILMDIMMPEMDGYETMRQIRSQLRFEKLPIIALTAKAMRDDRNKCIEAGASDYIIKPINTDQLLSLLKVWLYK